MIGAQCLIHSQVLQLRFTAGEVQLPGLQACTWSQQAQENQWDPELQHLAPEADLVKLPNFSVPHSLSALLPPRLDGVRAEINTPACVAATERLGPLFSFSIFSWAWRGRRLSFKLSSLFPGFSRACVLILSDLSSRFSQVFLFPFPMSTLAPTGHVLSKELPLHHLLPLLLIGRLPVVPWGDWKASLS